MTQTLVDVGGARFVLKHAPLFISLFALPILYSESFQHPFQDIKLLGLIFASALGMFWVFLESKPIVLPKLTKTTSYLFLILIIILLLNYYFHDVNLYSPETYLRLSFFSLFLYFLVYLREATAEEENNIFFIMFVGLVCLIILDLFAHVVFSARPPYLVFGNENMAAEYAGLLFGLMMGLQSRFQKPEMRKFFIVSLALTASYIFFVKSRSAYIGIGFILLYFIVTKNICWRFLLQIVVCATLITVSLMMLRMHLHDLNVSKYAITKAHSTLQRWTLLKNTLKMLLDHPLGIGLGQYEYEAIPYLQELVPILNERILYKSPHVEILRFMVEDGLLATALFLGLVISFIHGAKGRILACLKNYPEVVGYFLFLSTQLLFQFPLDNPLPLSLTAFMCAYFLTKLNLAEITVKVKKTKIITFVVGCFLLYGSLARAFSGYVERVYPQNILFNQWACFVDPGNWGACLNVVAIQLSEGKYDLAISGAQAELSKRPNMFQPLKYLSFAYLEKGDREKACLYSSRYDNFFRGESSLKGFKEDVCKS